MKRIILALACLLFGGVLPAQYHVVHVEGRILTENQKMFVVEGMVLQEESSVTFQSEGAELALWHHQKGRMHVKIEKPSDSPRQLKDVVKPGAEGKTYPAKPVLESKQDVEEYFKRGDFLLLGRTEIMVSKEQYPMGGSSHFFVTYHWRAMDANGNSRLGYHGDTLVLDTAQILTMNGQKVQAKDLGEFELVYYSGAKQYKTLCTMNLVMPNFNDLKTEVNALLKLVKTDPNSGRNAKEEVFGFLADAYGYPDRKVFDLWFDANF